ncbi:zinc-binding dehydrogenase family protein [Stylonychia lemnae]|uniref:Zinc-binding dehydrogenase family protein n=1 Tax=Stylonychia lemnae TaxID=5949 RepID=A0A078A0L7_STYLE|nr:zinc-binding dehydrogenase family protein [Stylonychia lemnae]|eukprot:CDW75003.1 zinc-binding dehydrogenase family protein [Stylonychia lemnae]
MESSGKQQSVKYLNGAFDLVEEDVPQPGKGQVLIEVHYSTVNPYDRIMHGINKAEGYVMGSDGCGIIVAVGEGVDATLIGKKAAFLGGGWSRYAVSNLDFTVLFNHDDFDLKQGANTYVNPFTVTAMLDFAKKNNASAVIQMAASSALAKQMLRLSQKEGIETVNIVRKDDQVKDLQENLGAKYVLNQESPSFLEDLQKVLDEVKPTVLFECVGGELPGEIFKRMAAKSFMVVYGNLSKQKVAFEPTEFHWSDKQIVGLMMFRWVSSLPLDERRKWFDYVAEDLYNGGKIFGSKIAKEVPIEQWREALPDSEKVASEGKYLINCKRQ